jgi:hypothetical protein
MMCHKILISVIILIALALAIIVSLCHQQGLAYILFISRFFDVMLPVLGVGALLKYLLCSHRHCCCKSDDTCQTEASKK